MTSWRKINFVIELMVYQKRLGYTEYSVYSLGLYTNVKETI